MSSVTAAKSGIYLLCVALTAQSYAADEPYTIRNGKVDANTFQGWQTYQNANCELCHGAFGQGGPGGNLVEQLKTISKEEFVESVTRGKGLMPPSKTNKNVIDNLDGLYGYLKARSDGALGEGKPERQ